MVKVKKTKTQLSNGVTEDSIIKRKNDVNLNGLENGETKKVKKAKFSGTPVPINTVQQQIQKTPASKKNIPKNTPIPKTVKKDDTSDDTSSSDEDVPVKNQNLKSTIPPQNQKIVNKKETSDDSDEDSDEDSETTKPINAISKPLSKKESSDDDEDSEEELDTNNKIKQIPQKANISKLKAVTPMDEDDEEDSSDEESDDEVKTKTNQPPKAQIKQTNITTKAIENDSDEEDSEDDDDEDDEENDSSKTKQVAKQEEEEDSSEDEDDDDESEDDVPTKKIKTNVSGEDSSAGDKHTIKSLNIKFKGDVYPASKSQCIKKLKECGIDLENVMIEGDSLFGFLNFAQLSAPKQMENSFNGRRTDSASLCYNCNQPGHMSFECPQKKSGGGRPGMTCYNCNKEGHMSKDCPDKSGRGGGGGGGSGCFKCGEEGHFSRECPNASQNGGGYNKGGPSKPTLFVKNLPDTVTVDKLESIFTEAKECRIPAVFKGFAFIEYESEQTLEQALKKNSTASIDGQECYISKSNPPGGSGGSRGGGFNPRGGGRGRGGRGSGRGGFKQSF